MKNFPITKQFWLIIVLIVLVFAGMIAALMVNQQLLKASSANACANHSTTPVHRVTLQHGGANPVHTTGRLCDRLVITNADSKPRLVAFGPHDDHVAYDGVAERLLGPDEGLTITMNQLGNYRFHDHLQDEVQGTFTGTAAPTK